MNNPIKIQNLVILLLLLPLTSALTGEDSTSTFTIYGQPTILSTNATNTFSTRGLSTYAAGWYKYPSLTEILLRGSFNVLGAENTAPDAPILLSPGNDTGSNTSLFTFSWSNSTDADNDTLSYYFEIYNDSSLTQIYDINSSIVETLNTATEINLTREATYYWRVLANDSSKNSTFSDVYTVHYDLTLPDNFNLTSPADGTSSTDNTPTLTWDSSNDTNFDNYSIELSLNSNFSEINITENSSTNSFNEWSSILSAGTYYWRVKAVDKANNIQESDNNLVFTVEANIGTISQLGPAVSVAGGISPKPYTFKIVVPPSVTIFKAESIVVPITIKNPGESINLNNIRITAEADNPDIKVQLDKNFINTLKPLSESQINLILTATASLRGIFSISITADVETPKLTDSARIITNVIGDEEVSQESAQQQLVFAKKFFDGNPECKDLMENLDKAESEIKSGNYASALNYLTEAVSACKDLIAVKVSKKPNFIDITMNAIKENKTFSIITSQVLGVFLLLIILFRKFFKRKPKQIKLDF